MAMYARPLKRRDGLLRFRPRPSWLAAHPRRSSSCRQPVRLHLARPYGATELFESVIASAREAAERSEKAEVASELTRLVSASGLSKKEFAARIGTSPSRLSTYLTARVVPSAALMVRARQAARAR